MFHLVKPRRDRRTLYRVRSDSILGEDAIRRSVNMYDSEMESFIVPFWESRGQKFQFCNRFYSHCLWSNI
jgi:hypothetical protein